MFSFFQSLIIIEQTIWINLVYYQHNIFTFVIILFEISIKNDKK